MDLLKIRDVKSPNRGTPDSAGIDFYVPKYSDEFLWDLFNKNKVFFFKKALKLLTIEDFQDLVSYVNDKSVDMKIAALSYIKKLVIKDADDDSFYVEVLSGQDLLIPSGIKTKFEDAAVIAFNKSGVATKQKMAVGACVDDPDYQGELHLHVQNFSDEVQRIYFNNKLVQFLIVPVLFDIPTIKEGISSDEFFGVTTTRGEGGFGSTTLK